MRCAHVILLSGLLSVTLANDILFYDSNLGCDGSFSGCFNAAKNVCCPGSNTGVKWMSISKGPYDFAVMYSGGGCTREFCRAGARGTLCCGSNALTGGLWYSAQRSKRDDSQSTVNCTGTADVNIFGYASDADGVWEIRADDVKEAFAQMHGEFRTLASHEKVTWLQAHAAVYRAQIHELPVTLFVDDNDVSDMLRPS